MLLSVNSLFNIFIINDVRHNGDRIKKNVNRPKQIRFGVKLKLLRTATWLFAQRKSLGYTRAYGKHGRKVFTAARTFEENRKTQKY